MRRLPLTELTPEERTTLDILKGQVAEIRQIKEKAG